MDALGLSPKARGTYHGPARHFEMSYAAAIDESAWSLAIPIAASGDGPARARWLRVADDRPMD